MRHGLGRRFDGADPPRLGIRNVDPLGQFRMARVQGEHGYPLRAQEFILGQFVESGRLASVPRRPGLAQPFADG